MQCGIALPQNQETMKSCCREVDDTAHEPKPKQKGVVVWAKRIGIAGFLFFLLKGIVWLIFGSAVFHYFSHKK